MNGPKRRPGRGRGGRRELCLALVHHSFTRRHRHARLCVCADWLSFFSFWFLVWQAVNNLAVALLSQGGPGSRPLNLGDG